MDVLGAYILSLYKPTRHATICNLRIVLQCKLNKLCTMSYGNKLVKLVIQTS